MNDHEVHALLRKNWDNQLYYPMLINKIFPKYISNNLVGIISERNFDQSKGIILI